MYQAKTNKSFLNNNILSLPLKCERLKIQFDNDQTMHKDRTLDTWSTQQAAQKPKALFRVTRPGIQHSSHKKAMYKVRTFTISSTHSRKLNNSSCYNQPKMART